MWLNISPYDALPMPTASIACVDCGFYGGPNLVHFGLKIWHLVATILMVLVTMNWPNFDEQYVKTPWRRQYDWYVVTLFGPHSPVSLKPHGKTARTTAHPNCCRRACMYDCTSTTVHKHDRSCSECPLLQVFKNVLVVGRLRSASASWVG